MAKEIMARNALPIKKGDRVEFTNPQTSKVIHGTVSKVNTQNGSVSVDGDDHMTYTWGWQHFRPSAVPQSPAETNPFRIGDRVEWDVKGKTRYATVKAIRSDRITADIDDDLATVRGNFRGFRKSLKAAPVRQSLRTDPPMALDAFTVTSYRATRVTEAWEGHEGNGYTANLRYNGKIVGKIHNEGVGGCGSLSATNPVIEAAFFDALRQAWLINGGTPEACPHSFDLMDIWAYWAAKGKNHGQFFWKEVEMLQAIHDKYPEKE